MTTAPAPLDPNSPVAEQFLNTLADIQLAIDARARAAQAQQLAELAPRLSRARGARAA